MDDPMKSAAGASSIGLTLSREVIAQLHHRL